MVKQYLFIAVNLFAYMGLTNTPKRTVTTAETVFAIIDYLKNADGGEVGEIAAALGLAESTTHTYLATLQEHEYVVKNETTYYLSLKPLDNGVTVRDNMALTHAARSVIGQLAAETNEVSWIMVEEHGHGVYLMKREGAKAVQTRGQIGKRTTMHDIATGKAILAYLPEERTEAIIEQFGLPERTENTITNPEAFREEMAQIREQGYATNEGETMEKVRALASPIMYDQEVCGSVGIAGPKHRLNGERFTEDLPNVVLEAADTIELNLTYR